MDTSFSQLEDKVVEAVQLIKSLRADNSRLRDEREVTAARCRELESSNEKLAEELDRVREAAARADGYEEKRRIIEEKVGGLLEKLEALG